MGAPLEQLSRSALVQDVVDRLAERHRGDPPAVVRRLLETELDRAGAPVGAESWLRNAAIEIAAGRRLVVGGRRHPPRGPVTIPAPHPAPRQTPPIVPAIDAGRRPDRPPRPRRSAEPAPRWTTWVGAVLGATAAVVVLRRSSPAARR